MLCGIRQSDNAKVFANASQKKEGPFYCPGCRHELVLKKGRIKVHHFAHKPPFHCSRGEGESEAHRKCKESIYRSLKNIPHVTNLDVEADFGTVIADVYCLINNVPVAIEVQRSNLTVNDITARTSAYEKLGIHVLWLGLFHENLGKDRYSPKAWEKWCHAAYFGRVYYWIADLAILPVHFGEHNIYVEPSSWYDQYGQEQSAGGYDRTSKRYKTPSIGRRLNLAADFKPSNKQAWSGGSIYVPNCRIYNDTLRKWW
jgi:competence protein CoiA